MDFLLAPPCYFQSWGFHPECHVFRPKKKIRPYHQGSITHAWCFFDKILTRPWWEVAISRGWIVALWRSGPLGIPMIHRIPQHPCVPRGPHHRWDVRRCSPSSWPKQSTTQQRFTEMCLVENTGEIHANFEFFFLGERYSQSSMKLGSSSWLEEMGLTAKGEGEPSSSDIFQSPGLYTPENEWLEPENHLFSKGKSSDPNPPHFGVPAVNVATQGWMRCFISYQWKVPQQQLRMYLKLRCFHVEVPT